MRKRVMAVLREAGLDPVAVESTTGPGVPDVNHVRGWLELKRVAKYPKSDFDPIPVKHFTEKQRAWILRRIAAGGRVDVLLQVEDHWYLLCGSVAAKHLGSMSRNDLCRASRCVGPAGNRYVASLLGGDQ
jgi:hypothetical protein